MLQWTDLKYPIFVFGIDDPMVYVIVKDFQFVKTTLGDLHSYDNNTIIDSTGQLITIKQAHFVKYRGLFGFNPLFSGRQIWVELELNPEVKEIALSDFKEKVIPMIEKMKDFWEEAWDIKELKEKIMNSISFEEIARLLY
jgi:hypothetical protein